MTVTGQLTGYLTGYAAATDRCVIARIRIIKPGLTEEDISFHLSRRHIEEMHEMNGAKDERTEKPEEVIAYHATGLHAGSVVQLEALALAGAGEAFPPGTRLEISRTYTVVPNHWWGKRGPGTEAGGLCDATYRYRADIVVRAWMPELTA